MIDPLERRIEMLEALVLQLQRDVQRLAGGDGAGGTTTVPAPGVTPVTFQVPPPDPPDPTWIPVLHRMTRLLPDWPAPCGKVGLYLTEPPAQHKKASFSVIRMRTYDSPEWKIPTTADEPRCSSCFALIDPFSSSDLDYLSIMQPSSAASLKLAKRRRRKGEVPSNGPTGDDASHVYPDAPADVEPLSFPAHVQEASQKDLDTLNQLARSIGLFDSANFR